MKAFDADPTPTPEPVKERKVWVEGKDIPAEQLEISVADPKLYRNVGTFSAKIVYKGLYNRTIEKTVSVNILDPNAPTLDSFTVTNDTLGDVKVNYPVSIAYHGEKWDKVKPYVSIENSVTKIKVKNVEGKDLDSIGTGSIKDIKASVKKNDDINKKQAKKLSKKVNKAIKKELPKDVSIRNLIIMPDMYSAKKVKKDKLTEISVVLDDNTKITIKSNDFTVDDVNKVVTFSGDYGGNLTFEELGLSSTSAK